MKQLIILALLPLSLTGCATGYAEYYTERTAAHVAEGERWKAMAAIAAAGDTTVKTVAMVTMGTAGGSQQLTAAPRSPVDQLLQAAGILVPAIVQGYGIRSNAQLVMRQSDNGAIVAQSTNATFAGIAGRIQAPAPNVSTSTTNANVSSNVASTDSHSITGSYNPVATTDNSNSQPVAPPAAIP